MSQVYQGQCQRLIIWKGRNVGDTEFRRLYKEGMAKDHDLRGSNRTARVNAALEAKPELIPTDPDAAVPQAVRCKNGHARFVPACHRCREVAAYFTEKRRERDRIAAIDGSSGVKCTCAGEGTCSWCMSHCPGCGADLEPHQRWCDPCKRNMAPKHRIPMERAEKKRLARQRKKAVTSRMGW